jgi:hydrogenase expression/formation protein HypE
MPIEDLTRILASMKAVSEEIGVRIVAGDTKVVEKGKGDGIYINTAGFGIMDEGVELSPEKIMPGDKVIVSASIGNHGMAVMAERSGISFDPPLWSDVCPLNSLVMEMMQTTQEIRVMRDPTRGGLATTLKEFAQDSGLCIMIREDLIPIRPAVQGACGLLGLDPLYVANEGVLVSVAASHVADMLVEAMRKTKTGSDACVIGEVTASPRSTVLLKTAIGGSRIIDMISGEQLPRIC